MEMFLSSLGRAAPFAALAAGVLAGFLAHRLAFAILGWVARRSPLDAARLALARFRGPALFYLMLAGALAARAVLPLPEAVREYASQAAHILAIAITAWAFVAGTGFLQDLLLARFDMMAPDNLRARAMHTKLRIFRRILIVAIGFLALSSALLTFESVRALGASLLASAGLAGIVLGFSAQKTLGAVFAGIQIAISQPIRLDDVVVLEGEWGRIEEITFTYVVVRIWDQRRLVVPINYFLDKPFQNWTRTRADILGSVHLHADYSVDVDKLRAELRRILETEAQSLWDGRTAVLQVTDAKEHCLELRALVSAGDGSKAWDLRCLIRERLVQYLQSEYPQTLPRLRLATTADPAEE